MIDKRRNIAQMDHWKFSCQNEPNQIHVVWCLLISFCQMSTYSKSIYSTKKTWGQFLALIPSLGAFNIQIHSTGIYWEPTGSWWIRNYAVRETAQIKLAGLQGRLFQMHYLSPHIHWGDWFQEPPWIPKPAYAQIPYIKWRSVLRPLVSAVPHPNRKSWLYWDQLLPQMVQRT